MSQDAEMDAAMARIGVLRYRLEQADAENACLKAECQARQAENSVLAVECDSLKAEVERLKEVIKAQAKGLDEKFGRDVAAKEGKQS
jgi:cell division protein FtsB